MQQKKLLFATQTLFSIGMQLIISGSNFRNKLRNYTLCLQFDEEIQMLEDQNENLLFSKMFGVSPKYKFKLTLAHKELWKNEKPCGILVMNLGAKYMVFVSSRSVKTRELIFVQFVYFLKKVFIFQFSNDEMRFCLI